MKTRKMNDGFTLMELLIVIAIIVVLVAIAIPVFKSQITKANETADIAAIRVCYSEGQEAILTEGASTQDALDKINALELNFPKKLRVEGNVITYTATTLNNDGSKIFTWEIKSTNIN